MTKALQYILITITLTLGLASVSAAEKNNFQAPDFQAIKTETLNPDSKYYYPKLIAKFHSNDTTMTLDEYRHLYYGYMFQEDYNPYRKSVYTTKVEPLYFKNIHTKEESDTILRYAEMSLSDDPFDLRQMMFFTIALKEKKKLARAAIQQFRLNHVVAAIMSSGNGTQEHPWFVISPAHEYNLLNFMNHVAIEHHSIGETIDYLKIKKDKDNAKVPDGYYFDVANVIEIYKIKFENK